ncbi:60S ribosomal protein L14 [Mytilinidion resinicola]|uniref:60S ribosomal protein L14 n=1 Tax=Mytilinidion resinicola TaxID=574789 RepID=A0A6A6YN58_9PEZI|nr:60S ribosomal protein L14 [Mytilinidion resinicola]KAF2809978.1 60S ribosomal protein L14 [Mytilinidion resinicola]
MGEPDIQTSQWRHVEVGRVVLFSSGAYEGRLAAIVEIIDHKRVLVDGPSSDKDKVVPRQSVALSGLSLTPIVIPKLPRAAGNGFVKKIWESEGVESKFAESNWAKTQGRFAKRKQLNDFERFKVMKLKKARRFEVQKTVAKLRASAKA